MKKLVLFDLDGTLLDTVPDIMACCNDVLTEYSLPLITREETKAFVGNGAKKLVERMLKDRTDLLDQVYLRYQEVFPTYHGRTTYFDGEEAFFEELKGQYTFAIVTNKPQKTANAVIKKFFPDLPVFGGSDDYPLKPDPTLTEIVIQELGFTKEETVFVGDGETDVLTAINAGIDGIAVLWGYRDQKILKEAGAVHFASDFIELKKLLALL